MSLDPIASMPETVTLALRQLGFQQHVAPGVFGAEWEAQLGYLHDQMILRLTAYVLSEQAGPVSSEHIFRTVAKFPRYVPKWLRRRWSHDETVTLTVTPEFIYPSSVAKVPELRSPVRFIAQRTLARLTPEEPA